MDFVVSEVAPSQTITASQSLPFDLGVNGLSYLFFHVTGLQAAVNVPVTPENLLAVLDTINVAYNGQLIFAGRGTELARIGALISRTCPVFTHAAQAANAETGISFVLPFGRMLFDPTEGFPSVQRGQLVLSLIGAGAFTNLVTPRFTIQEVQILGQQFKRYNKYTQRVLTPQATGLVDVPLPIGNVLRGVMLRQTTRWRDLNSPGTIRSGVLLVNNNEKLFTGGQLAHELFLSHQRLGDQSSLYRAARIENTAAAYTQNASTTTDSVNTFEVMNQNSYFDLDWTRDDSYSLDTKGLSDLALRVDVATAAEEIRVFAYESVSTQGFGR